MKVVFMGTPDFAVPALEAICQRHEVVCVYTKAPKEAGRGQKETKSPIHIFAEDKGIEVRTPKSLKSIEEQELFCSIDADIAVVAAYGLILPKAVIEAFSKGCVNIHGSLLPRWRGAAPIQRAIEAGDDKSGITIMEVVEALDAGKMYLKGEVEIDENTTGEVLHDKMAVIGADLIVKYLDDVDNIQGLVQNEALVTYAHKIDKAESKLDFNNSAEVLECKIRAFNPYPATYFEYESERFKLLKVKVVDLNGSAGEILEGKDKLIIACQDKALEVVEIQRQGKKPMQIAELLRGFSFS